MTELWKALQLVPVFLQVYSQNKLATKYVLQFLTESGHQVTKYVPCWAIPVHEHLCSCTEVRQNKKKETAVSAIVLSHNLYNHSTSTSAALKVPKELKNQTDKNQRKILKKKWNTNQATCPCSTHPQGCICLTLLEDEVCQKQWHLAGRILHLHIQGSCG